jgi:hypothetical protein
MNRQGTFPKLRIRPKKTFNDPVVDGNVRRIIIIAHIHSVHFGVMLLLLFSMA